MTTTMHQLRRRRAFLNELSKFVGCTVWLTGLPSSGKTTLSKAVENVMLKDGVPCYVLDGDEVRKGLNSDLDFTEEGRHENIRRFAHVARLMADSGQVCIVSAIAPYEVMIDRVRAKEIHAEWEIPFIEVFVDCPLSVCTQRDVKGLYAWARKDSNIKLTGLSAPYEKPQNPDITIDTDKMDLDSCVHRIVENLYVKIGIKSENFTSTSGTSEDLVIDAVDLQWMQVLVEGWAAPLNTFMDENDYLQSLHFRSIERNGKRYSQSIPIILAIDDFDKQRLLYAQKINLIYNGKIRGILEKPTF